MNRIDPNEKETANFLGLMARSGKVKNEIMKQIVAPAVQIKNPIVLSQLESA